ncbi:Putative DNA-binding protein [Podospora comata]|uniref:DNA-binding protein n=1 Tax=Podospora comata TaxID=48703 RepID=A0ABY6SEP4_PODCO|nr:Putative DNA-binding protein [Podospora comata]
MTMGQEQSAPRENDDDNTDIQSGRSSPLPRWDHPENQEQVERQHAAPTEPLPETEPPPEASKKEKKKKKKKKDRERSVREVMDSPGRSLSQLTPLKRKKTRPPSLGNVENVGQSPDGGGSARRKLKKSKRMSLGTILNDNADAVENNDSQDSFVPQPTLPELESEPRLENNEEEDEGMEDAMASQRRKSSSKKKDRNKKAEPEPEPEPEPEVEPEPEPGPEQEQESVPEVGPAPEAAAVEDDMELDEAEEDLANLKTERPDHDSDDDVDMEDGSAARSQHVSETPAPQEEEAESPTSPIVHVKSEPGVYDEDEDMSRLGQGDSTDEEESPVPTKTERLQRVMDEAQSAYDSEYIETDGSNERSQRFATQVSPALDHEEATPSEDEVMQNVKSAPEEDEEEMNGTPASEASPAQALKAAPESEDEEEGTPESEAEEEQVLKAEEEESEVDDEEPVNDPLEDSADEEEVSEERFSEIPESDIEQPEMQHEEPGVEPPSEAGNVPTSQSEQAHVNGTTVQSSPDLGGDDVAYAASPSPPPPSSARARSSTKRKVKRAFNPDAPVSEPDAQPETSSARPQKKRKSRDQPEEPEEEEKPEEPEEEPEEEEAPAPTPAPKKKRSKKIREVLQEQEGGEIDEEVPAASTPAPKQKKTPRSKKSKKAASEEQEEKLDKHGYATGRLTAVEEDKVTKAVNKFRKDEGLTQAEINRIIQENPAVAVHNAKGAPTLHAALWTAVCDACPSRSRLKLQKFCRRKFHNFVARGQWTAEQDEELQEMMKIHGNKWTVIGGLINRHPQDVRDRWRDYIVCRDKVVKHDWSNEEEAKLTQAVKEAVDKIRKDLISRGEDEGQAESLVNWQAISEAMGRTRNRLQCMEKWKRILKAEPIADRDRVITLLPDTDNWRVKLARQDLTKITPAEKYRLACVIRDGCTETEREIDWKKITERIFKDKYQRQALVVIWGRLRSSVPHHGDKTVHECAQHIVDRYEEEGGFGDSYGNYPDEQSLPPSAKKRRGSAKKPKEPTTRRRSTSVASAKKKKKELSEAFIVDETDSEGETVVEDTVMEDTVMEDAASIASDAPPIDSDEEHEEEAPEEAADEEAEAPPQSSVVKRLAPEEDDTLDQEDETRPPFVPSPSVEADAARTRRRERSLSNKPPTPAAIEEESGEEVQDEDMVTSTRLKSAKKRPATEEMSPRKKKRKTNSESTVRPAVLSSPSPAVTYGRKSNSRKENKKAAAEAVKARQARALSTISSDMDDMDDIPARLPGQTPPGRVTRRVARK